MKLLTLVLTWEASVILYSRVLTVRKDNVVSAVASLKVGRPVGSGRFSVVGMSIRRAATMRARLVITAMTVVSSR